MYRRKSQGLMKHLDFMLIELLCFQAAFWLACVMRHGIVNPYISVLYRNVAIVGALLQIFFMVTLRSFHNVLKRGYYQEFMNTVQTVAVVMLSIVFYLFVIRQAETFSRLVLVTTALYYWALSFLLRSIRKYVLRKRIMENEGRKSLVLITTRNRVEKVLPLIQKTNYGDFKITGVILMEEEVKEKEFDGIPVVSDRAGAAEYICRDWVDEVFLDLSADDAYEKELMDILMDMSMVVHIRVGSIEEFASQKQVLQKVGGCTVVTITANILRTRDVIIKRMMDILGGVAGCIITGLLFVVLAPMIYIQSPGPIFFSQMRVGRNGKMFKIYKFRSMYMDAEQRKAELEAQNDVSDGMMFKMKDDPRIIGSEKGSGKGIGNFIRKYSLDEFPQFFNILKGDMSLVGTRPPTVDEWEKYHYHHRSRLSIKPGLTGMWQVSGRSDITDFEDVVALDTEYINHWTIGLDIKILLKTIVVIFKKEGAR